MRIITIVNLLFFFLFYNKIYANGGPIDASEMLRTGNIVPLKKEKIHLTKENLNIRIDGNYAIVDVQYILTNTSNTDQDITYGFPIDLGENSYAKIPTSTPRIQKEYLPYFSFKIDSIELKPIRTIRSKVSPSKIYVEYEEFSSILPIRYWHVVNFKIPAGSSKSIKVSYKVKSYFGDSETNKSIIPSFGSRIFAYDMSPAKSWDNGKIDSLHVSIDATTVKKHFGTFKITGLKFNQSNGIYTADYSRFDLTRNSTILIKYYSNQIPIEYLKERVVDSSDVKYVRVTSSLSDSHNINNLFDLNIGTAWADGDQHLGKGQSIEVGFNDIDIYMIGIVNGFRKDNQSYRNNRKVKIIDMDLTYVKKKGSKKEYHFKKRIKLDDLPFKPEYDIYQYIHPLLNPNRDFFRDEDNYDLLPYRLRKMKLTIADTYGKSEAKHCFISELILQKN